MISRAALLYDDALLLPEHLPSDLYPRAVAAACPVPSASPDAPIATLAEIELSHIRRVLSLCGGNRTLAAQKLGVTRQTLSRKLEEAGPA